MHDFPASSEITSLFLSANTGQVSSRPVYVLDEDRAARVETVRLLREHRFAPRPYLAADDLLEDVSALAPGCIMVGALGPPQGSLALLAALGDRVADYPVVVSVPPGDVKSAVLAMQLGACDVIESAMDPALLPSVLDPIFDRLDRRSAEVAVTAQATDRLSLLSPREYDILSGLVEGLSSKQIAFALGLNLRTIEASRSRMMHHLQAETLSEVLGLAFRANVLPLAQRPPKA